MRTYCAAVLLLFLAVTACGQPASESPPATAGAGGNYCEHLKSTPDRLRNMLLNSLVGSLTSEQASFADETAKQLRADADAGAPESLKTALNDVAGQLEQVQQNGQINPVDAAKLTVAVSNLEREIKAACP